MNKILYTACYLILKPLVRILLRKGISFGELSQIAKRVYVQVAEDDLTKKKTRVTTSQIAIITGLTRKDVANLRKLSVDESAPTTRYNRGVRVIDGWKKDKNFNSSDGEPAKLSLLGGKRSFEQLVERYSGDMPYRAMLQELERINAVEVGDDKSISLLVDDYIPHGDEDAVLEILGIDVAHLITTFDHNMSAEKDELRYQRKVAYDNLPIEAIAPFKAMVDKDAQALLVKFNKWLAENDRDSSPEIKGTGKVKAGVGIYYFEEHL
ncbi:MAG: hypothetical protein KAH03_01040 [Cocleimonas sp.]|nr:hypothetical protein [Cocleimonas sp.]